MATEVLAAKTEVAPPVAAEPALASVPFVAAPKDVVEEKAVVPVSHEKVDHDSKAVAKTPDTAMQKPSKGSLDRDIALTNLETEKRLSFIKAWEESEKTKAENKAQKKLSEVTAWENSKRASIEADLKKIEEQMDKKKADYAEKMRNKIAMVHKQAEENRAIVDAKRREELLKAEEIAAKYRATNQTPKTGCFGC